VATSNTRMLCRIDSRMRGVAPAYSPMPGYTLPMTNPYGITLDHAWKEWATNHGVSPTVAAAVFLISEARPIHEVMAKLAPDESEQVADIVSGVAAVGIERIIGFLVLTSCSSPRPSLWPACQQLRQLGEMSGDVPIFVLGHFAHRQCAARARPRNRRRPGSGLRRSRAARSGAIPGITF